MSEQNSFIEGNSSNQRTKSGTKDFSEIFDDFFDDFGEAATEYIDENEELVKGVIAGSLAVGGLWLAKKIFFG